VVNACADQGRQLRRSSNHVRSLPLEPSVADDTGAVADREQLERGFERLRPEQRAVVVLHYYSGFSAAEIAQILGIPKGTARSRLCYATETMRAALHDEPVIVNLMVQYPAIVDRAFAALADPTRRAVLERLGSGSATISDLADPFGMSLTGMRKHIRVLEGAQLVTTEKVGRARRCTLAPHAFEGISTWLQRSPIEAR
jgi:DNA-binding transcriptional ArsR family regulator